MKKTDYREIPLGHEDAVDFVEEFEEVDIEEEIDNCIGIVEEADTRKLLEKLTICDIFNAIVTNTPIDDDMIGLPPAAHDYLLGLILTYGGGGTEEVSYQKIAGQVLDITVAMYASEIGDSDPDQSEEIKRKSRIESTVLERELSTGRFMMSEQPIEAAKRAYTSHDQYLQREFGFTTEEAIKSSRYIDKLIDKTRTWSVKREEVSIEDIPAEGHTVDSMVNDLLETGSVKFGSDSSDFIRDSGLVDRYYSNLSEYTHTLSLTEEVLLNHSPDSMSTETLSNFLTRMSSSPDGHANSSLNPFRYSYQFNPLHEYPIIQWEERYFIPQTNAVRRALIETYYYDLISLEDYGDPSGKSGGEFGNIFGDYLEDWTYDCLSKTFGKANVLHTPLYPDEDFEEACDILVPFEDTLYVAECKTGKLPLSTRRGDYEEIQSVIEEKVGEAHNQAVELIEDLQNGLDTVIHNGEPLELGSFNQYQPIIIVREPYDSISTFLIDDLIAASNWHCLVEVA